MASRFVISLWNLILTAVCLLVFFVVNLDNVLHYPGRSGGSVGEPEVERPHGFVMITAALGTGVFFLESLLYLLLGILSLGTSQLAILDLAVMESDLLEYVGGVVMVLGYAIFIWSVIARGRYATSWTMPPEQQLVDWGPYRYVRHPSYLGYFLMFIGFLLVWPNILALIPLVAIPGYYRVTIREEEMLVRRFGDRYLQYRQETGRFLPRTRLHRSQT